MHAVPLAGRELPFVRAADHARIVDHDVEPPIPVENRCHEPVRRGLVREVGHEALCAGHPAARGRERVGAGAGYGDLGALGETGSRNRGADAARSPGDERNFSMQPVHRNPAA